MATDFFQRQDTARTNTAWLVFLFVLAVVGIVVTTAGLATLGVWWFRHTNQTLEPQPPFPWAVPVLASIAALAVVGLGSFYKVMMLRSGGGSGLAEHLGGTRLYPNATELHERRLLNVVEEMALASGTPVPPVYLLDEEGINAFAAGYSPSDAVVGVTRGAVETLSREQLQGVIAHEFSHILNGDMRLNIRLIGILHGILVLGLIGHFLLRSIFYSGGHARRSRSDRGKGGGGVIVALLAAGVALVVIGFLGHVIGGLIKAAVSRQREYLADASAVQFTRNPSGIAGALKRIGAAVHGSRLRHPGAPEASHLFFAKGVAEGFTRAMATHPPLRERILAIEPTWDGVFPKVEPSRTTKAAAAPGAAAFAGQAVAAEKAAAGTEGLADRRAGTSAAESVGAPREEHRQYVAELLAGIDHELLAAARDPYGARAAVYALLLDSESTVRQHQMTALQAVADPHVVSLMKRLLPAVDAVRPEARLPLIDLSLPALRALSPSQYQTFDTCFRKLMEADEQISLFEWTLSQILSRHLQPQFAAVHPPHIRYYGLQRLSEPCSVLVSVLAYAGHDVATARVAFAGAADILAETPVTLLPPEECDLRRLHQALQQLRQVAPKKRGLLVDACAAAIRADRQVTVQEAELLRGIADLLDCPMPPLLAGQSVGRATPGARANAAAAR